MKNTSIFQNRAKSEIFSPVKEITAYEALWTKYRSVKKIADIFRQSNHDLPSNVVEIENISTKYINEIKSTLNDLFPFTKFSALFYGDFEYPNCLRDAKNPIEVLYYQGALDLLSSPSVSVVGARKASSEGLKRAKKITHLLVTNNYTVMSGLAEGIDTAAHEAAIEFGGKTIAVIGTALNHNYPKSNVELQKEIAKNHLLISQVPFYQYSLQNYRANRYFFPERNKTMSALSLATVIVEASDTSGTLIQARAALSQGRKLFILNSCFEKNLEWTGRFLKRGAIKVVDGSEIIQELGKLQDDNRRESEMA